MRPGFADSSWQSVDTALYLVGGKWRLHYMFAGLPTVATISEAKPRPLSKDAIAKVLEEMSTDASSAVRPQLTHAGTV
jgi:hypothetical protein